MPHPTTPKISIASYSRTKHMPNANRKRMQRNGRNVQNMFGNNENVVNITQDEGFNPEATVEVPLERIRAGLKTPNRPTRQPWGRPGFLPSNAPRRKTRRNRK